MNFVTYFSYYLGDSSKSLYLMPNFIYSFALAKFNIENRSCKNQSDMIIEESNITDLILYTEEDWNAALKLPTN